jgi:hypothetical protein
VLVCAICAIAVQSEGGTPLFLASQEGRVGVVRALVGAGAIVDQSTVRYRDGILLGGLSCVAMRVVSLPMIFSSTLVSFHKLLKKTGYP